MDGSSSKTRGTNRIYPLRVLGVVIGSAFAVLNGKRYPLQHGYEALLLVNWFPRLELTNAHLYSSTTDKFSPDAVSRAQQLSG